MKSTHVLTLATAAALFAGCAGWHENFQGADRISFNQMTPAAQNTVRNEVGNQPITAITQEYKYGEPSYRIEVQRATVNPSLWVAADGSIIKESRRLIGSNLPGNEAAGAQPSTSQPKPSTSSSQTVSPSSTTTTHYKPAQSPKQSSGSNY